VEETFKEVGVPNRQKDKGSRFERECVNVLKANGIEAKRVPLSGAAEGFKGDIIFSQTVPDEGNGYEVPWRGECKHRADGFKQIYGWIVDNDCLFLKADRRETLVVLRLDKFVDLIE